ncbi:MAG TPA: DUF2157 domain-containing protein, partial [Acidimicrobiales bacterium]|nr:DUF2157 domain-containing protein [Acidimicrobiales bacterium]
MGGRRQELRTDTWERPQGTLGEGTDGGRPRLASPCRHADDRASVGPPGGATWVASTGAFLLVVAAAVFVAVQWDRLGSGARLLLAAGVTGACLWGGRALRPVLPATGDVVFHLGAFLLPVDLAAVALQADLGWRALVLAE